MFLSSYQFIPEKVIFKIIIEAEEKERVNERRMWEGETQENKVITKNRMVAQQKERQMWGKKMRMLIGNTRNWKKEMQRIKVAF